MIAAHEKIGDSERTVALFREMTELGVSANVIVDDAESVLEGVTKLDLHELIVPVGHLYRISYWFFISNFSWVFYSSSLISTCCHRKRS